MNSLVGTQEVEWKDPDKETPKLIHLDHYDNDPELFEEAAGTAIRWSKDVLVVAEDEDGLKHEVKAHYTFYEWDKVGRWERSDKYYGEVALDEEGLKVIKWADLPKKKKK